MSLDELWFARALRAALVPSDRIISWTTKDRSVVLPSVPLTSESFKRLSSLNASAPPRYVPTFIRLPVLRTASKSFKKSRLFVSTVQATYKDESMLCHQKGKIVHSNGKKKVVCILSCICLIDIGLSPQTQYNLFCHVVGRGSCNNYNTSKVAKDSLTEEYSSGREAINIKASRRLNAKGISTNALRNFSEGPRRATSPLYVRSFSSSSWVGAIFNKVEMNSTGSSLPTQKDNVLSSFYQFNHLTIFYNSFFQPF